MDNLMGNLNSNSAGFRSEFCLSALSDIYFPVCRQFLSLPKSHTCFYPSFIASIVKFPGTAWLRLISPCLYRESVFSTASFSVHSTPSTNITLPLYSDTYFIRIAKGGSPESCRHRERSGYFSQLSIIFIRQFLLLSPS